MEVCHTSELFEQQPQQKKKKEQKIDPTINITASRAQRLLTLIRAQKKRKRMTDKTLNLLKKAFEKFNDDDSGRITRRKLFQSLKLQTGFDLSTLHYYFKQWLRDPTLTIATQALFKSRNRSLGVNIKQRIEKIQKCVKNNPFVTLRQIALHLIQYQERIKPKNSSKMAIHRINISRHMKENHFHRHAINKVSTTRNSLSNIQKRYEYCQKYINYQNEQAVILFFDQCLLSGFLVRQRVWVKQNTNLEIDLNFFKDNSIGVLSLFGVDGFQNCSCLEKTQYFSNQSFLKVFQALIADYSQKNLKQKKKVLVMNEKIIFKYPQIHLLLIKYSYSIQYFPPQSQQLNPVQNWFQLLKLKLRKNKYLQFQAMKQKLYSLLSQFKQNKYHKHYRYDLKKYVNRGINKQPF